VDWVGVNCGTMDQLAVALGKRDHALLLDCRSLELRPIPLPQGTAVVILDTTKARTLAGSAYNVRRKQCEEAAQLLGATSLRDVSLERFRAEEGRLDPVLASRARHVISENARTLEAASAMAENNPARLGALMDASHESLRADYEVSCSELDAMVAAARAEEGCYGARMTGAGFGGCAVALVKETAVAEFLPAVTKVYREKTGLEAKLYVTRAEAGVECE
jgi:galactokinase